MDSHMYIYGLYIVCKYLYNINILIHKNFMYIWKFIHIHVYICVYMLESTDPDVFLFLLLWGVIIFILKDLDSLSKRR